MNELGDSWAEILVVPREFAVVLSGFCVGRTLGRCLFRQSTAQRS